MTIGVITAHFPPKSNAASNRVGPFVESWSNKDNSEVHVYTHKIMKQSTSYSSDADVYVHRAPFGIAGNTYGITVRILSETLLSLSLFIQALYRRVDVFVTSSPSFIVAVATMLVSLVSGTPYVADIRDIYPEQLFVCDIISRNSVLGSLLMSLEKAVYDYSALVVTVNNSWQDYIQERTETDVVLAHNGVDTNHFVVDKSQSIYVDSANDSPFVILFHGTLGRTQNVDLLIQYAKFLRKNNESGILIRIAGEGPKRQSMEKAIERYRLESVVDYIGYVDFENIPKLVVNSDVGLCPHKDDYISRTAIPVKMYECLACGSPVITTPFGEAGKLLESNDVGFQHKNNDVGGIHESVLKLKNNPEMYNEYSDRAVRLAKKFDRHDIADNVYECMSKRVSR